MTDPVRFVDIQVYHGRVSLAELVDMARENFPDVSLDDIRVCLSPDDLGVRLERREEEVDYDGGDLFNAACFDAHEFF